MPDMSLEADQNTINQISLFQHDRVGAALFLPGGTVIIDVLLALDRVGFPGHAPSTGVLLQGRQETHNHKLKNIIHKPAEEWVRIENAHSCLPCNRTPV